MQTNVSWMQARTPRVVYVLQSNLNRCFRWQAISNLLPGLCTVNVWSKNSDLRRMLSVNIYFGLLLNYVNIQEHAEFILVLVSPSMSLHRIMMFCDASSLFRATSAFIHCLVSVVHSLVLPGLQLVCTQKAQTYLGAMFPPSILREISVSLNSFTSKPLL